MTLADNGSVLITAAHCRFCRDTARICPEAQCASHVNVSALSRHKIYYLIGTVRVKFTGAGFSDTGHVSCKFDNGNLHAQTDSKIRQSVLSGETRRFDHPLNPSGSETSGYNDTVKSRKFFRGVFTVYLLCVDPVYTNTGVIKITSVAQSFRHRKVSVMQRNIFARKSYINGAGPGSYLFCHLSPLCQIRLRSVYAQFPAHNR